MCVGFMVHDCGSDAANTGSFACCIRWRRRSIRIYFAGDPFGYMGDGRCAVFNAMFGSLGAALHAVHASGHPFFDVFDHNRCAMPNARFWRVRTGWRSTRRGLVGLLRAGRKQSTRQDRSEQWCRQEGIFHTFAFSQE